WTSPPAPSVSSSGCGDTTSSRSPLPTASGGGCSSPAVAGTLATAAASPTNILTAHRRYPRNLAIAHLTGLRERWFHFPPPLPDGKGAGIDHRPNNRGGIAPPPHRCRDPLHQARAGAMTPKEGDKARQDHRDRHQLGSHPFDCAMQHRLFQVDQTVEMSFLPPLLVGEIEVEEHHHASLGIEASQRDNPHPHRHAQVVA